MMDVPAPLTLDVRADLRRGMEPLPRILETVASLDGGQSLRLLVPFEPIPLYSVLRSKGYAHRAARLEAGGWEILFSPTADAAMEPAAVKRTPSGEGHARWDAPSTQLDNRGLSPPEPLVRILEALECLQPGQVLEAVNDRDPVFLYPELEARGHAVRVDKGTDGVRIRIRVGGG